MKIGELRLKDSLWMHGYFLLLACINVMIGLFCFQWTTGVLGALDLLLPSEEFVSSRKGGAAKTSLRVKVRKSVITMKHCFPRRLCWLAIRSSSSSTDCPRNRRLQFPLFFLVFLLVSVCFHLQCLSSPFVARSAYSRSLRIALRDYPL
jgi:hypothetical protein